MRQLNRMKSFGRTSGTFAAMRRRSTEEGFIMIRNLKLTAIASLTVLSLVAGGCAGPESHTPTPMPTPSPDQPGTPQGPGEPINNTPPPTAKYSGVYSAVAPIDLTQNGVLPGVLGPALGALIELHDHPGKAILDIVAIANIPTVSDAVKNMPQFLKDILSDLLDKLIIDEVYANVPVVDQITNIISGITELAKTVELHNSLTVHTPAKDGTATIDQQVTDIGFKLLNQSTVIAFDANEKMMAHTSMPGTVKAHANAPVADADLTLGGGKMTLPFGELLLQAAGPLLFGQFGGATDLKGALHNLVDCQSAARTRCARRRSTCSPIRLRARSTPSRSTTCRSRVARPTCSTSRSPSRRPTISPTACRRASGIGRSRFRARA
jgi:hypothetical protein